MKNQLMICKKCGSCFDIGLEGYYNKKTRRYLCADCGDELLKRAAETQIGLKRTAGGTFAKILLGILCVLPPEEGTETMASYAVSIFIGIMAFIWAALPFVAAHKLDDRAKNKIDIFFKIGLTLFCIGTGIEMAMNPSTGTGFDIVLGMMLAFAIAVAGASPYIKARKAREEAQNLVPASASPEAHIVRICPFCGAPSTRDRCEYCGSEF